MGRRFHGLEDEDPNNPLEGDKDYLEENMKELPRLSTEVDGGNMGRGQVGENTTKHPLKRRQQGNSANGVRIVQLSGRQGWEMLIYNWPNPQ